MSRIALLEPYYTGSHKAWADGLARFSRHDVRLLTLPGRFWKWRMHGGAVTLARRWLEAGLQADLIVATDMVDLTTFTSLTRESTASTPVAVYFHENQLTYPPPPGSKRDLHYGFINYASMLAADAVLFNSAFHREAWFAELPRLLKHFPDFNELGSIDALREKSTVLPLGMDLQRFNAHKDAPAGRVPTIVWNHRWEYDKQPEVFFEALYALESAGIDFRVTVLGESFRQRPEEFLRAQERLHDRLVHFGYAQFSRYAHLLWQADIQVSTAIQDFFGISTCEAIWCGCTPLLPNRLNYPALIPEGLRTRHLYDDPNELVDRLKALCRTNTAPDPLLAAHVRQFDWRESVGEYDRLFDSIIQAHQWT